MTAATSSTSTSNRPAAGRPPEVEVVASDLVADQNGDTFALTMLNTAVFAAIPKASTNRVIAVKQGFLAHMRIV